MLAPERRSRAGAFCALIALLASACVVAPPRILGDQCDLSSECDAPLICALGRCRNECAGTRDCALGLRCVVVEKPLGACLLPDEVDCELTSECPEPLICAMAQCTNECAADVDCVAGARCVEESCVELSSAHCAYSSECDAPLVCLEGQCVGECRDHVDCPERAEGQLCWPHETCLDEPCMCRFPCTVDGDCPNAGTVCVDDGYCERASAP